MKAFLALLSVLCFSTFAESSVRYTLEGAWMQAGVHWIKVPSDIVPNKRVTQAAIIYFGENEDFGLIYCTVYRASERSTISLGDPRDVYKGKQKAHGRTISITHRLVEVTIPRIGQKLPGPMQNGTITMGSGSVLTFEGKTFRRARALDETAREAIYGIRTKRVSQISPAH